ncbi:MAG: hypothetical protein JW828_09340 [Sedimentisphaerales bacterium]|nr:hypothetical protein [Sedimentisphaerales bacterium]
MKRTGIFVLTAVILVCLVGQSVLAQPAGRGQGRQGDTAQGDRPRMMGGEGMFGGLNLDEKQQAKMNEIRTKYMDQIRTAESAEARRDLFTKMREEVNGILTAEQRAQMQQRMGQGRPEQPVQPAAPAPAMGDPMAMIRQMAEQLNLTQEQQTKVAELYRAAMQKFMTDIREQVLTEEQRTRLGRRGMGGMGMMPGGPGSQDRGPGMMGRGGMFGMEGLDLSEDQQKKMDTIRQKYMDQMQNADRDSRREVFTKMREEMDSVLTEEQKKKAEELRQQRGFGGRGQGQEGQGPAGRQGGQGAPGSRRGGAQGQGGPGGQ